LLEVDLSRRFVVMTVFTLALGCSLGPLTAEAQRAAKIARVGFLAIGSPQLPYYLAFREGMRDLGYNDGHNLVLEARFSQDARGLDELAIDLVRLKVDVIVVVGGAPAEAARRATKTIPIVLGASPDPVEAGFVASHSRPGGNITGMSWMSSELAGKRLEFLREIVPNITRVAVLSNPDHPGERLDWREIQAAAQATGLSVQYVVVRGPGDFDAAFEAVRQGRAEALVPVPDAVTLVNRKRIADFALAARLPTVAGWSEFPESGCLLSYGPNLRNEYRGLARYVDRILKGAFPATMPIERPSRFQLVINLKTAKTLGLTIPQGMISRADQVIE
jgi:putative ABC transport system substrate-binding protein